MKTSPKEKINSPIARSDSYVSLKDFLRLYADTEDDFEIRAATLFAIE